MIVPANADNVSRAAAALAAGQIVALPTETVYGLAADALNGQAVAAIFALKNRPHFNPLIAHVSSAAMAADYVEIDSLSAKLMAHFWPGPLSFVLPLRLPSRVSPLVTAGLSTLAVRCPQGVFAEVIRLIGRPLAAPSANISGKLSPTSAQAVAASFGDKAPLILDGGVCSVGVESTIIKIEKGEIHLLRAGGIAREQIESVAGRPLSARDFAEAIEAPGQLASHYAPNAGVRLNADKIAAGEALLAFGPERAQGWQKASAMRNLSESGDLHEAAAHLFAYLAELDRIAAAHKALIAAEPIPQTGLGAAINDRLRRAAADRD